MSTIKFGEDKSEKKDREQTHRLGLVNSSADIADVKTYVDEYTKISKVNNWERMSLSTVLGEAALALIGSTFDGRYVYYTPYNADAFIRFDTQGTSFTTEGDWQKMTLSTAQGSVAADSAYRGATFDGRYVYFSPFNADTFLRYDTKGTSFATTGDWHRMNMSTAQGGALLDAAYLEPSVFDGRYVYFSSFDSNTLLRFDTQGTSFTTAADWTGINMSTAQGAATLDSAYSSVTYDGKYIYFIPQGSASLIRVLTTPSILF